MIGTTIAHYRITAKLGEGGMGAVYRATDTKLGRDVAIKVLPDTFAQDPDRMARFQREAQVLASLNHPNIAAIYGVEDRALIMELVEGEDLAGPVPVSKAIGYAHQLTDALSAAHDKGIIHRDLKPANIKITPEGVVKVLDFGLAKAADLTKFDTSIDPVNSPTVVAGTMAGVIMGTAAYMAPEQARGQVVDKRADIWAFGVVLFEMLTGRQLFAGETVSDTLASVMKDEIDFSALPKDTPSHIRTLLKRCLERDRRNRLRDLGDAWFEAPLIPRQTPNRLPGAALALTTSLIACVLGWGLWRATRPIERPLLRFHAEVSHGAELAQVQGGTPLALSADGNRLAVTIRGDGGVIRLATRQMHQTQLSVLPGTENAHSPFFSPDGMWIGFFADGKLKKISVRGGSAITLCDARAGRGASWGDDGNIVFSPSVASPLVRVAASGGTSAPITTLKEGERTHRHPFVLPGSKAVLFTTHTGINSYDDADIDIVSLPSGQRKTLHRGGYAPMLLASGHLIHAHRGSMFATPFDAGRLRLVGVPVPVLEDLVGESVAGGAYSVSTTGTLAYLRGRFSSGVSLVWLDSSGATSPLRSPGVYTNPRISPDGKRMAVTLSTGTNEDVWIGDLERGTFSRLTFVPGGNRGNAWTPDGKYIFFVNFQRSSQVSLIRADGSGEARPAGGSAEEGTPHSFSPDARRLVLTRPGGIYVASVDWTGDVPKLGNAERLISFSQGFPAAPRLSHDGKWLAYAAYEDNRVDVFVRPFPGPGGKWQISAAGGHGPNWSPTSNELFFVDSQSRINVVSYVASSAGAFQPGPARVWSERRLPIADYPLYSVAPDGKRIAVLLSPEGQQDEKLTHLVFLVNFFDEVRRRIRTGATE